MTISSVSYLSSTSQSPVSSYTRNNQLVTTGYDADNCVYWYRIDFGMVREFSTALARDKALDLVFEPSQNLDLPQLPAWVPGSYEARVDRNLRRNRIAFQSKHGKRYPTFGVIALPAPKASEPLKPQLTPAQQKVADEFLDEAVNYFNDLCAMDNRKMADRDRRHLKWTMDCHFHNMSNKAFTLAQMVSMGVH